MFEWWILYVTFFHKKIPKHWGCIKLKIETRWVSFVNLGVVHWIHLCPHSVHARLYWIFINKLQLCSTLSCYNLDLVFPILSCYICSSVSTLLIFVQPQCPFPLLSVFSSSQKTWGHHIYLLQSVIGLPFSSLATNHFYILKWFSDL